MLKMLRGKLSLVFILAITLIFGIFSIPMVAGQEDIFSEIRGKMTGISEKERATLQKLFIQVQEIEELEKEEKGIGRDVEKIKGEIEDLQKVIADEAIAYEKKREGLKQVLQSYQRMGPGSYLEILLESKDLQELLRRINMLRDLTRNTGELLEQINRSKEKQLTEKTKLSRKLVLLEDKQMDLMQALARKKQLKEKLEQDLAALQEEKEHYQEYLAGIQQLWGELKPFFRQNLNSLSRSIEEGNFSQDAFKLSFGFSGFRISIDEKSLNKMILEDFQLQGIIFSFQPRKAVMQVPEKHLVLAGKFVIIDRHSLKFVVEEGSFFGLPLENGSIKELFQDDFLVLNLKSQLDGYALNTVEILDGSLSFFIKP